MWFFTQPDTTVVHPFTGYVFKWSCIIFAFTVGLVTLTNNRFVECIRPPLVVRVQLLLKRSTHLHSSLFLLELVATSVLLPAQSSTEFLLCSEDWMSLVDIYGNSYSAEVVVLKTWNGLLNDGSKSWKASEFCEACRRTYSPNDVRCVRSNF